MTKWAAANVPVRDRGGVVAVAIERPGIRTVVHVTTRDHHQPHVSLYPIFCITFFLLRGILPRIRAAVNTSGADFRKNGNLRKSLSIPVLFFLPSQFWMLLVCLIGRIFRHNAFTFPLSEGLTGEESPGPPRNGYFLPRGRPQTVQYESEAA